MSVPRHRAPRDGGLLTLHRCEATTSLRKLARAYLVQTHRRLGPSGFVLITTAVSVGASVLFSVFFRLLPHEVFTGGLGLREVMLALAMAVLIPVLVVPPMTWLLSTVLTELERTVDELELLANTDDLTRALNRRGFLQHAAALMSTARDGALVLTMMDLDEFKQLNDRHGHDAGDQALLTLADELHRLGGPGGVVGRLGGDEFAMLVHVTDSAGIEDLSGRLQASCRRIQVGGIATLAASYGCVVLDPSMSLETGLRQADRNLYLMKANRRVPQQAAARPGDVTGMPTFALPHARAN